MIHRHISPVVVVVVTVVDVVVERISYKVLQGTNGEAISYSLRFKVTHFLLQRERDELFYVHLSIHFTPMRVKAGRINLLNVAAIESAQCVHLSQPYSSKDDSATA